MSDPAAINDPIDRAILRGHLLVARAKLVWKLRFERDAANVESLRQVEEMLRSLQCNEVARNCDD